MYKSYTRICIDNSNLKEIYVQLGGNKKTRGIGKGKFRARQSRI